MRLDLASTPQNAGLPSRASMPSIMARTPCPGSSTALRRYGARSRASRATRRRQRMAARERKPRRALQQVGVDRRGIDDARLRQRQRAGLVEDDGVDLGQPLDRVAGIEDHAGAEQRARRDHLHGRDRERQRTGAGDDQHGDRGDDGVVQPTRRRSASRRSVSAAVACTTGA